MPTICFYKYKLIKFKNIIWLNKLLFISYLWNSSLHSCITFCKRSKPCTPSMNFNILAHVFVPPHVACLFNWCVKVNYLDVCLHLPVWQSRRAGNLHVSTAFLTCIFQAHPTEHLLLFLGCFFLSSKKCSEVGLSELDLQKVNILNFAAYGRSRLYCEQLREVSSNICVFDI